MLKEIINFNNYCNNKGFSSIDLDPQFYDGKIYDIFKFIDTDQKQWAIKKLNYKKSERFYGSVDLESVFNTHIDEYYLFQKFLPDFITPTEFFKEIVSDSEINFYTLQYWINNGIQYKEAIKNKLNVLETDLGLLDQRILFFNGINEMITKTRSKLPDLDFFLIPVNNGESKIEIFDTNYFWFDRRDGKDRSDLIFNLSNFIFSKNEITNEQRVGEIIKNALSF